MKRLNEEGMTLLDTMIIASILLIMITALASWQFQQAKQNRAQNALNLYQQLQTNLNSGAGQIQSVGKSEQLGFDSLP
jgi:type II secretory pathway pseudopilin PulG